MAIFDKNDFERMKDMARLQKEMETSGKKFAEVVKEIGELQRANTFMKKELVELEKEYEQLVKDGKEEEAEATEIIIKKTRRLIKEQEE